MKKRTTRILALLIAVILVGGLLYFQSDLLSLVSKSSSKSAAPAAEPANNQRANSLPVKALIINSSSLQDFIAVNGSTIPNEEVVITSEVPGLIAKISFTEGTSVKKGTNLVHLDDKELQAQRKRLQVQQELNEKIAERFKELYEREGVSLQEYEVAKAEADKVKADIALVDAQLEKRIIKAPFSGKLGLRQVSEGSYLSPGAPIVNLVSINPIKLEFSVPEKYTQAIRKGTKVEYQLDGSDQKHQATVIATEPNIDPATRTFRIKASAPNSNGKVLPGAFANVAVNLTQYDEAFMVPTEAIIPELGGKKIFVYRSGQAQTVEVETGIRQASMIQVTSGLVEGDTVITSGVLQIRPGSPVSVSLSE